MLNDTVGHGRYWSFVVTDRCEMECSAEHSRCCIGIDLYAACENVNTFIRPTEGTDFTQSKPYRRLFSMISQCTQGIFVLVNFFPF